MNEEDNIKTNKQKNELITEINTLKKGNEFEKNSLKKERKKERKKEKTSKHKNGTVWIEN